MKNYNKLKKIIQKANSEKFDLKKCPKCGKSLYLLSNNTKNCVGCSFNIDNIPITLADVLITLNNPYSCYRNLKNQNKLLIVCNDISIIWNLKQALDNQSKECKQFLIDLLV